MKQHIFEIGEVIIDKHSADELRNNIRLTAVNRNILWKQSIRYKATIADMKNRMEELKADYEFLDDDKKPVDFDSNFMFTEKVLKDFFSQESKNSELITMRSKNLDILSFYAYGKPWNEVEHNNKKDNSQNTIEPPLQKEEMINVPLPDNDFKVTFHRSFIKKVLIIFQYPVFLAIVLLLVLKDCNVQEKLSEKDKKYQKLQDEYVLKENRYQETIRWYNDYYWEHGNWNYKNDDTLKSPEKGKRLFLKRFSIDPTYKYKDSTNVEILKSNNKFKDEPGIKDCGRFGGTKAFGFGKTYCQSDCCDDFDKVPYYSQRNCVIFRVNFHTPRKISYITFQWVEINGNWGSFGNVFINGKKIGTDPYQCFGIYPNSNLLKDETVRNFKCSVDENAKYVDIVVQDIADGSEIFIDNIDIYEK